MVPFPQDLGVATSVLLTSKGFGANMPAHPDRPIF